MALQEAKNGEYSIVLEVKVNKTRVLRNPLSLMSCGEWSQYFSFLAKPGEGPIRDGRSNLKRCRSEDRQGTEFLIWSRHPTGALDMEYKIVGTTCLLVSIPKCLVSITVCHFKFSLIWKGGLDGTLLNRVLKRQTYLLLCTFLHTVPYNGWLRVLFIGLVLICHSRQTPILVTPVTGPFLKRKW